jgi:hypothetical protein|tara:strand:+ start:701 stop:1282 length:582 start_codon:yes stop_codon:yes gene_type:complete
MNTNRPLKGDLAWEETYCSRYCRAFDDKKLKMVPFESNNKHQNNKLRWPKIELTCQMCDNTIILMNSLEKANRGYCSIACWSALKGSQNRGFHRILTMLSFLHHQELYDSDYWYSPSEISERCSNHGIRCSPTTVGLTLKRWKAAGIISIKNFNNRNCSYKFNLDGLRGNTLSKFIYLWNTMSYAERLDFQNN